jgi:hypothetical protein
MGLDSIWVCKGKKNKINFNPPLRLCSGYCSNGGKDSFRGNNYYCLIFEISGINIYKENTTNKEVKIIAKALSDKEFKDFVGRISLQEFNDLKRMFNKYAKLGYSLIGFY